MVAIAITKRNYAKSIRNYILLMVVTLAIAGYYGFTQYQKLSGAQEALAKEQNMITTLQNSRTNINHQYSEVKKTFDQKFSIILNSLQSVYPLTENYTDLARAFDDFFSKNNVSSNPVFVSDLKFGLPRFAADNEYAVLPVNMTISGTQDNFMKFLKFIENSGTLKDKTRLMDMRSISINFPGAGQQNSITTAQPLATEKPTLNVSVSLNAYFQKPFQQAKTTVIPS